MKLHLLITWEIEHATGTTANFIAYISTVYRDMSEYSFTITLHSKENTLIKRELFFSKHILLFTRKNVEY